MDEVFAELWAAAKQAGPFASMLLLIILYVVNDERKQLQRRNDALIERVLNGLNETTNALKEITDVFYRGREGK